MNEIVYPAVYQDSFGKEITTIHNDGKSLRMRLRGVGFRGNDFNWFKLENKLNPSAAKKFNLIEDKLWNFSLDVEIPIQLVEGGKTYQEMLRVHTESGYPDQDQNDVEDDFKKREIMQLEIVFNNQSFKTSGRDQYNTFDEQFTELIEILPEDVYLKICWFCAYSDYHFSGSGAFGHLACFREIKEDYLQVTTKKEFIGIWGKRTEDVQEIHLCPEFQKRQPGIGGLYVG